MAVTVKANQITGPGATGSFATTDPGFQPSMVLQWNGLQTATGATADAQFNLGFATGGAAEISAGYNSDDNVASSDVVRSINTTNWLRTFTAGTTTANVSADFTSMDASGFTQSFATLTTTSPLLDYLAVGGADITGVKVGSFASNTGTGNQSVTGVGFQPDIVFLFGTLQTASGAANNQSQYSLGVMTPTDQWSTATKAQNGQATMNTSRAFSNTKCFTMVSSTTNAVFQDMTYVSMDSDGFTFNITTAGGTAILIGYAAVKGGRWKVGTDTQKTSTGTKATTGVGWQPTGLILASVCDTQTAGTADHSRFSFGATTGTSNNIATWNGDTDNVPDSICNTIMSNSKCIVLATEGTSATPTTNAEAALSSFDSDGFTLNWSTADATARVFGYVAVTDNAAVVATTGSTLMTMGVG